MVGLRHSRAAVGLALLIGCLGIWAPAQESSCQPQRFMPKDFEHQVSVWSPDQSRRVQLRKNRKLRAESGGINIAELELPVDLVSLAIKWSPDSRAFYIEASGNAIGGEVTAYNVVGHTLLKLQGPEAVVREFAEHHACKAHGNNLQVVRWEDGSQRLLLMPEVPDASECGEEKGYREGFLVDAESGKIVKQYPQAVIEAEWKKCRPDEPGR
jgi:hypothetical protein